MIRITKETELSVRSSVEAAEVARLMTTVAMAHVETRACCTYCDRNSAVLLLVTDNAAKAGQALRADGFSFKTNTIVLVSTAYEPRLAARLARRLAEARIGVLYSYASWNEDGRAYLVFKTSDDDRAVRVLSTDELIHEAALRKAATHLMLGEREVA